MSKKLTQFASESVASGHPDKVADAISDAVLDRALEQDKQARVAIETLVAHESITLAGELTTTAKLDLEAIARQTVKKLGYIDPTWGFSDKSKFVSHVHQQSPEIAIGVDNEGAGDQGILFGYATNETPEYLPLPIVMAHKLTKGLDNSRETGLLPHLRPDGKAQVVVNYVDGKPAGVDHVTIAVPHHESLSLERIKQDIYKSVVSPALEEYGYHIGEKHLIVNGTGAWHIPGPSSDAGLTGRKIVVDGYGGFARVGGGAFSGKDPSKVDRSGAYASRYIAKNIVAKGYAEQAEVRLAYYIGGTSPVQFEIETFGSETVKHETIRKYAETLLDLSVKGIIDGLDLRRPIYSQTSAYGHFGKNELPWEKIVNN